MEMGGGEVAGAAAGGEKAMKALDTGGKGKKGHAVGELRW
jgi:hypothetical protein